MGQNVSGILQNVSLAGEQPAVPETPPAAAIPTPAVSETPPVEPSAPTLADFRTGNIHAVAEAALNADGRRAADDPVRLLVRQEQLSSTLWTDARNASHYVLRGASAIPAHADYAAREFCEAARPKVEKFRQWAEAYRLLAATMDRAAGFTADLLAEAEAAG